MSHTTSKRTLSISEVCVYVNCSRSTVYKALASGHLKGRKNGRSTIILIEDAEEWLKSLPSYKGGTQGVPDEDTSNAA
jgi:excisionase family DNA binding protein